MPELKSIEMEHDCFKRVSELKLIGMKGLERVLIGENCFTKKKDNERSTAWTGNHYRAVTKRVEYQGVCGLYVKKSENDKNAYGLYVKKDENDKNVYGLYVKNCELLRELKIGNHSFEEYSVCEIENVGSLEVIEVGNECFKKVSELKLKSDCSRMRMMNRHAQLEVTSVW